MGWFEHILVFFKNVFNLLLLLGTSILGWSTSCYNLPGMLRLDHDQCEFMSMVDQIFFLFTRYHFNCQCRSPFYYSIPLVVNFGNYLMRSWLINSMSIPQVRFPKQCIGYRNRCHIFDYFIFERINEVSELALSSDFDLLSIHHPIDVISLRMQCGYKT